MVQAQREIAFGFKKSKGQEGREHSLEMRKLLARSPVLVYCTKFKQWKGPNKLVNIDKETIAVKVDLPCRMFRS